MKFINEMWAVIPARSGSKGLRNKNIKKINGIHLIGYSILISHKIKDIKKIIFSSDSNKYLNIAKKYGCDYLHKRSKKNSSSKASELSVFQELLHEFIKKGQPIPKFIVHFRPTTPLRNKTTIEKAINYFKKIKNDCTSFRTVSELSNPAFRYNRIINGKLSALTKKDFALDKWFKNRQFFQKTYVCNCVVDIYKSQNILKGTLFGNNVIPYVIKDYKNDVDELDDFKLIEHYIKMKNFKI
jgi:CMP-N-acetylneuraminic acid synthetase